MRLDFGLLTQVIADQKNKSDYSSKSDKRRQEIDGK